MRQDTAELASWALSDVASIRGGTPPRRHASPGGITTATNLDSFFDEPSDHSRTYDDPDSTYPAVIQEVSEPTSPESHPSLHPSTKASMLTEMIRTSYCAMEDEDRGDAICTNANTSYQPVEVRPGIISQQPHEGTALLRTISSLKAPTSKFFRDIESLERTHVTRFQKVRQAFTWSKDQSVSVVRTLGSPKTWDKRIIWQNTVVKPAGYIPAILLGLLLNILDALSYGMHCSLSNLPMLVAVL